MIGADRPAGSSSALDEQSFTERCRKHRRELHIHCYRMLASFEEAEDAVQETMLRAWRARGSFDGSSLFRAWLYRIATNVCLDQLRQTSRRLTSMQSFAEVSWLQPYPDRLLDEATPEDDAPESMAVDRETIEIAFMAAMQVLPARQRAAFIVRDVLGWSAKETASLLETSVPATNSALQRARATMQAHLPAQRGKWSAVTPDREQRALLDRFIQAHEACDAKAAIAVAAPELRVTMPPYPMCFNGLDEVAVLLERAFGPDREGDWRLVRTAANRMPAAASYLRRFGDSTYRAFKLDVLRIEGGKIAEITTFGWSLFPEFGLELTL